MTHFDLKMVNETPLHLLATAHRDGTISIMEPDGTIVETLPASAIDTKDDRANVFGEDSVFVSLEFAHGTLASCTSSGHAKFHKVEGVQYGEQLDPPAEFELPAPISVMRLDPFCPGIFAFGGKENDLQVWTHGQEPEDQADATYSFTPHWNAKNVKNDFLDLRVPVWISDIACLPSTDAGRPVERLLACTRFQQIRLYETRKARRPTKSVEIGEYPLSQMIVISPTPEEPTAPVEVIVIDSASSALHIDLASSRVIGSFKGFSGAINNISLSSDRKTFIAGGMDGYLRTFDVRSHTQICSIYIGTKILACLMLPEEPEIKTEQDEDDIENDELWQGLDEANDESRENKRPRRS